MIRPFGALAAALAAAAAGGCGDEARVRLVPIEPFTGARCGRADDIVTLVVTALGDFRSQRFSMPAGAAVELGDLPATTEQLAVEVLGLAGAKRTVGKSAPLELGGLASGDDIPVMMVPPDGFCPVGDLAEPRDRPLVVAAAGGALVLGGDGPAGARTTAEWYDPRTGRFEPVAGVPSLFEGPLGFTGAAATALPDGRVVVSGGPEAGYTVFDPAARSFERPGALGARARHAAVALDDHRVLVAGGCRDLGATGACTPGTEETSTQIVDVTSGDVVAGPALAAPRLDGVARLEAAGAELRGLRVLVAGGVDAAGAPRTDAERIDPDGGAAAEVVVGGAGGEVVALDGGATLTARAGAASVIVPGVGEARAVVATGATGTLTLLEDGSVLSLGGNAVARYLPARPAWRALVPGGSVPPALIGHGAVRLDDGSVLVVGGRDGDGPHRRAYVFRPSLIGPTTGEIGAFPATDGVDTELSPLDPGLVEAGPPWRLRAGDGPLRSWALVTGPRPGDGFLDASVRASGGGVAALVGFVDPAHFDAVELAPAAPARLVRHAAGAPRDLCRGSPVELAQDVQVAIRIERRGGRVTASVAGLRVLDCAADAPARGLWGLGPLGAEASLVIDTATVGRP